MSSREQDAPVSTDGANTGHSPVGSPTPASVDPYSTAQPPCFIKTKGRGRDSPQDASIKTNVVAISLLTSPMTSSLYTRNSSDAMQQLPTSRTPYGERALNGPQIGASPSQLSGLSPAVAIANNIGLRYRGPPTRPGQVGGHGPARLSGGGRRASAVTVLSSDMDNVTDRGRFHPHRSRRTQTNFLPFNNPLSMMSGTGTDRGDSADGILGATFGNDDTEDALILPEDLADWNEYEVGEARTCGSRLRGLIYPQSADVGIEGAEKLIDQKMAKHSRRTRHHRAQQREEAHRHNEGGHGHDGHNTHLSLANEADEGLMHIELPVAAVLEFTAQQRRMAELRSSFCWYLPVLMVVTLFILFTAPQGAESNLVTGGLMAGLDSNLELVAQLGRDILLESMRIDTETYSNDSREDCVEGGSVNYPWLYTHYNETINAWTPQPEPNAAVDEQVSRVARHHRSPTFVNFRSLRTKRDVMRWLKTVFLPLLWDCQSPQYERPWLDVVHGSDRRIGAARLTARRRATTNDYTNSSYVCKRASLAGLDVSCQAGSGTERHDSVAPPLVPTLICNIANPALPAETLFVYQSSREGYVAHLPFSSSCSAVGSVLGYMETRKESILWPPFSREYAHMTELWSEYAMDTSSVDSCSSFFFHRSVTELEIEYVLYVGAQNAFHYTRITLSFAATGSVVVPTMRVYVAPALSWDTHFAQLGIGIVVVLAVCVYAGHCLIQFMSDYHRANQRAERTLAVDKDSGFRGVASAVQSFLRLWPIVCFVALAMSVAAVVAFWSSLGRDHNRMGITFANRNEFPSEIADLCLRTTPVYRRLGVAALFFVFMYLLRFAGALLGPWVTMEAIQACATRIFTVSAMWFFVTIGVAVCGRLLFGGTLHEFSSFGRSYMTVTLLFVDRCRFLFTQDTFPSDRQRPDPTRVVSATSTEFDSTLPSVRGSRLRTSDPVPLDAKRRLLEGTNSPELHVFMLFIVYIQFFFFLGVLMASLTEAFRQSSVALHISRMPWSLTLRHVRRALSLNYAKESFRRLLWARRPALLFDDIAHYVSLTDVVMSSRGGVASMPQIGLDSDGRAAGAAMNVLQSHLDTGAHISYAGVLWRFPREFQAEFGGMHLRQWWLLCVDSVRFLHHNDTSWLDERLAVHYDAQPSGLQGRLEAGIPSLSTLESRVFSVDNALEELPHKIVRYVELEMQEAPPLRAAEAKW